MTDADPESERWAAVDRYFSDRLSLSDPALEGALADSAAAGLPEIQVSPSQGKFLHLLARALRARTVIEVGTLGGYSAIWLARALPPDGRLLSLELSPKHAEVARANLARADLSRVVEVRVGPAIETLPKLVHEGFGPFDLAFIDADKPSTADYFDWTLKLARPGSVIVVDNVVRNGAVADPKDPDPNVQGIRRFFDRVAAEPRVSATALQTVGAKAYDGFAFVLVLH